MKTVASIAALAFVLGLSFGCEKKAETTAPAAPQATTPEVKAPEVAAPEVKAPEVKVEVK